ncbi:MAG: histidine kinase [Bacillota bacterium]
MKFLKLIIVEDSEDDAMLVILALKRGGYRVEYTRVETSDQLHNALQEEQWNLIISDHGLPDFNAPDALNVLKESGHDLPFIIVSSIIDQEVAVAAMKAGAYDYVMKDNLARLIPVVEKALYNASVRTERKKTREKLFESEARFRNIAEHARDIIYRIRLYPDLKAEYINPSVEDFAGYSPEEFYNNPHLVFETIFSNDRNLYYKYLNDEITFKEPIRTRWENKNGEIVFTEQNNVPFYDDQNRLVAIEGIARDITRQVIYEKELEQSNIHIEALSKRILGAIEEERSRLARELHDELGQALTAVKLDLQLLNENLPENKSPEGNLKQSIDLIDHTIDLVRRLSVSLRPPALDDMGLLPAMKNMVNGFMKRTGIKTTLFTNSFNQRLAQPVETALYRCVQESLTNIARHANASNAKVTISKENGILKITICDDGIGFEVDKMVISSEHIGLTGMKERIKLLNGTFRIDSVLNEGTTIIIKIPWQEYRKEVKPNESVAGR